MSWAVSEVVMSARAIKSIKEMPCAAWLAVVEVC